VGALAGTERHEPARQLRRLFLGLSIAQSLVVADEQRMIAAPARPAGE
jgi:hypothetical protein